MRQLLTSTCVGVAMLALTAAPHATTILPADLAELATSALVIVHGRVVDVRAEWSDDRRSIESFVTLEVAEYFKGNLGREMTFRLPGGEVGGYRSVMIGAPAFTEGEEVVLFLGAHGPSIPHLLGLSQGVFRVIGDRRSGVKLVTPPALIARGPEAEPVVRGDLSRRPVPLDEFETTVRSILAGLSVPRPPDAASRPALAERARGGRVR